MERKKSVIKYMLQRILFSGICITLLICSFALPASAAELDYNDYITNIQVDGDNDIVTVSFPVQNALYQLYDSSTNLLLSQVGSLNFYADSNLKYRIDIVPLWPDVIDLSNIPQGAVLALDFQSDASGLGFWDAVNLDVLCYLAFPYGSGTYWRSVRPVLSENFDPSFSFNLDKSDDNGSFFSAVDLQFSFHNIDFLDSGSKQLEAKSLTATMSISSLYRLQQQTGKTNEILSEVEKQLADQGKTLDEVLQQQQQTNDKLDDTNNKLEDLISGGSGADDLIAGGEKIENAGDGLGEDIGKIEDFEDQYMGQLEDNLGDVIAGADLTWLYPPLMFVQRYLNKIVAGIPSKYLIVFTLPMLFGLFMYIVGHPVRAPRPDTSGDQVTRETFTETTILKGPHAGRVSATRTVTTSQEIGRVHNE